MELSGTMRHYREQLHERLSRIANQQLFWVYVAARAALRCQLS